MQNTPVSRRGALVRLLGLGVAATAAVALPAPVEAAPLAPTLPDWLAADPELTDAFERLVRAHALLPDAFPRRWSRRMAIMAADEAEISAGLRPAPEPKPREVAEPAPSRPRPVRIELDRNARRRARRWIKAQPYGPSHPTIRLRAGRGCDYLAVGMPQRGPGWQTAYSGAEDALCRLSAQLWTDRTSPGTAPVMSYALGCSHTNPTWDTPDMVTTPDGRLLDTDADYRCWREEAGPA